MMGGVQVRGGIPEVYRASVDNTTGVKHRFPFITNWLRLRATGNPCKVYFTAADYTADANYILVPVAAAATPHGEWEGPLELEAVWLKGSGGASAVELVSTQRRG